LNTKLIIAIIVWIVGVLVGAAVLAYYYGITGYTLFLSTLYTAFFTIVYFFVYDKLSSRYGGS
jgi:hypothetical protein